MDGALKRAGFYYVVGFNMVQVNVAPKSYFIKVAFGVSNCSYISK